jgi:nitrous oxidase accessory protein NosD
MNYRSNASNVSVLRNYLTTGMRSGLNTTIASNTFLNKGITLGSYVTVAYNNFTGCDIAINMAGYNNIIGNNNFQSNQVAIHIFGGGNNQVYRNNFIANAKQAEEQHSDVTCWPMDAYYSSVNNTWYQPLPVGGNYWSDYRGNDLNSDGIGDTPYHIIENHTDQYPLIQSANVIQPASENLLPSETALNPTLIMSPADNSQPALNNPPVIQDPNQTNPSASPQTLLWVSAPIALVAIIGAGLLVYFKKHKR